MITIYVTIVEFLRYQLPFNIIYNIFGRIIYKSKYITYVPPRYLYDILHVVFTPLWLLLQYSALLWLNVPNVSDHNTTDGWEVNKGHKIIDISHHDIETAKSIILSQSLEPISNNVLFSLYDQLPSVQSHEIANNQYYEGYVVNSNSTLTVCNTVLQLLRLCGIQWGKRYITTDIGDPWLWYLFNKHLIVPAIAFNNISLHNIEFRNDVTSAMIYDNYPWIDYFKLLHKNNNKTVLLGMWVIKGKFSGFFTLTSLNNISKTLNYDTSTVQTSKQIDDNIDKNNNTNINSSKLNKN